MDPVSRADNAQAVGDSLQRMALDELVGSCGAGLSAVTPGELAGLGVDAFVNRDLAGGCLGFDGAGGEGFGSLAE